MAHKSQYWRLSLTIDEIHPSLERAAQAAFGFLTVAPTEQVVLLRRLSSNQFMTVDRDTYFANRSTMKHQATTVIFMGNMSDLATLAFVVPPSLFKPASAAPRAAEHTQTPGGPL
jgi:hypothetical protein